MDREVRCPYCGGDGGTKSPVDGEWSECMECNETGVMTVERVHHANASFAAYTQDGWSRELYKQKALEPVPAWIINLPDAKKRRAKTD